MDNNTRWDFHRWRRSEVAAMLDAIATATAEDRENFERPTAQVFYNKIKLKCNLPMDITWKAMKGKIRHLKEGYSEVAEMKRCNDAGFLNGGDENSVEKYMKKKCEFYPVLEKIFGEHEHVNEINIKEEDVEIDEYNNYCEETWMHDYEGPNYNLKHSAQDSANVTSNELPSDVTNDIINRKFTYLHEKLCVEKRKMALEERKYQLDKEMNEQKLTLEAQRLTLEQKKLKIEDANLQRQFELKKLEIESNKEIEIYRIKSVERLKILEIEMENRDK